MNENHGSMTNDHQQAIVLQFNKCINNRDIAGLAALLTDDHMFIDSVNTLVCGKEPVVEAWKGFLRYSLTIGISLNGSSRVVNSWPSSDAPTARSHN